MDLVIVLLAFPESFFPSLCLRTISKMSILSQALAHHDLVKKEAATPLRNHSISTCKLLPAQQDCKISALAERLKLSRGGTVCKCCRCRQQGPSVSVFRMSLAGQFTGHLRQALSPKWSPEVTDTSHRCHKHTLFSSFIL